MSRPTGTPALTFAAFSGTGKTTLLRSITPMLRDCGIRLGLIKHCHHGVEVDIPGKDSFLLRQAGAERVVVASRRRTVVMESTVPGTTVTLESLLQRIDGRGLDLILVEGFKHAPIAKIELHRPSLGHSLLYRSDRNVIAVASDAPLIDVALPVLDLNDPLAIATFIQHHVLATNEPSCQRRS